MTTAAVETAAVAVPRIRWRMAGLLFSLSFLAYMQQKTLTIAALKIMPDLRLSQGEIGWLEQAFIVGYAAFQLPGGLIGQRLGGRLTLALGGLVAITAMLAFPLLPLLLRGGVLFAALFGTQLLLGAAQGALNPVMAGLFEAWFPPQRWALLQGLMTMGLELGAAATPPLIATLMESLGWQRALFFTSLPAIALVAAWARYARNSPAEHPGVTARELREIAGGESRHAAAGTAPAQPAADGAGSRWRLLASRNVLLLTFSYLGMNYAFYLLGNWVFLYLVQERGFSALESGWLAAAPPLAAAFGAGLGGYLTDLACRRLGARRGFRLVPLLALPTAGALLLIAVDAANAYLAVIALSVCFGCVELTEGAFWGAAMTVGRRDSMAVGGVLNTGGNLAGIIGVPVIAYLSGAHHWRAAFLIGAASAVASALLWLAVDVERGRR